MHAKDACDRRPPKPAQPADPYPERVQATAAARLLGIHESVIRAFRGLVLETGVVVDTWTWLDRMVKMDRELGRLFEPDVAPVLPDSPSTESQQPGPMASPARGAGVIDFTERLKARDEAQNVFWSAVRLIERARELTNAALANPLSANFDAADAAIKSAWDALNTVDIYRAANPAFARVYLIERSADLSKIYGLSQTRRPATMAPVYSLRGQRRARTWPTAKPWEKLGCTKLELLCVADAEVGALLDDARAYRAMGTKPGRKLHGSAPWDIRHLRAMAQCGYLEIEVAQYRDGGHYAKRCAITAKGEELLATADRIASGAAANEGALASAERRTDATT